MKDTLFSPIDIDYNNLSDVTTEENKYYGISFKELDGFLRIKTIKYKSTKTVTNNKIILAKINDTDNTKIDIIKIIPIEDSIIGENTVDTDIYIYKIICCL